MRKKKKKCSCFFIVCISNILSKAKVKFVAMWSEYLKETKAKLEQKQNKTKNKNKQNKTKTKTIQRSVGW